MRGNPIARSWVVMMHSGVPAVDWGGGTYLDILTGQFFKAVDKDVSHRALDSDLDWLKRIGRVEDYDITDVVFTSLPNLNSIESD